VKKIFCLFSNFLALSLTLTNPGFAITDGELDGEDHPHVVLLVMEAADGMMYRCSGTLLSADVVLTAGHCVNNYPDVPYTAIRIFTESDVENGDNNYPYGDGNNTIEAIDWEAHPDYESGPFYLHDVGVVILEEPHYLDTYGTLPALNHLDEIETISGKRGTTFTTVGYGLQQILPHPIEIENERVRMVSHPFLIQINVPGYTGDYSLLLSNNRSTGGSCFGDSGGPNFLGDGNVIAGITSWGNNINCVGTGGVFRMDRETVLEFVWPFIEP